MLLTSMLFRMLCSSFESLLCVLVFRSHRPRDFVPRANDLTWLITFAANAAYRYFVTAYATTPVRPPCASGNRSIAANGSITAPTRDHQVLQVCCRWIPPAPGLMRLWQGTMEHDPMYRLVDALGMDSPSRRRKNNLERAVTNNGSPDVVRDSHSQRIPGHCHKAHDYNNPSTDRKAIRRGDRIL